MVKIDHLAIGKVNHRESSLTVEMFCMVRLSLRFITGLLVPYSRKPAQKNKKTGDYFKIRILKLPPRHLSPPKHGD
jgi:hypothetical protein